MENQAENPFQEIKINFFNQKEALLFQKISKKLVQFFYFRPHHILAIGLLLMQGIVVVVVYLCWIEIGKRRNLSYNRRVINSRLIQFVFQTACKISLCFIPVKNG
jgi:hypothetical protein